MIEYKGEKFKKNGKTVIRMIRFGAQGMGHNFSEDARKRFKSRFRKQIAKADKGSAMFWANKFLWGGPKGIKRNPPKES